MIKGKKGAKAARKKPPRPKKQPLLAKKTAGAAEEEQPEKQPLIKRLLFGPEKPDLTELEAGSTTILDILSPTSVDTKSRDYIVVDGVFHAYLYITGYGYTTTVGSGWLTPLVEAGEGVSLYFVTRRQPKDKILAKISQTTMINRSRMRDVGDTRQDYEELDSAINAGLYLKDVMNRQGEDFYFMNTLLEITANDPETLEQRVTAVENLCTSIDMIAKRCDYRQEQGFLSALPLLSIDPDIERKSRRNTLTSGVAAAFPFASYELSDKNGIFLGINMYNKSPVFLDFYDDYKYTNANFWIGGSTGAGKTCTIQCIGGRLRQQGKRVIFIVPKKGHEYRALCEKYGGQFIRLGPASKDCISIMDIRTANLDVRAQLRDLSLRNDSVLAQQVSELMAFYSLRRKDMTDEEKNYIDASLLEVYQRFGIGFENDTLLQADGSFKEMPTIHDWYGVLMEREETKSLAASLTRYVTGSAASMGGQTNVDVDNKFIVLDISGLPEDLLLEGTFIGIKFARDMVTQSENVETSIVADELWKLVGASSNQMVASFTTEMVKTIRGLGGSIITATQGMQDMYGLEDGKYGKAILDSSRIKLVMQMEEQEARLIQSVLNLSEDEVRQITRLRRGEGLLCIGYNHVPVAFHPTQLEYDAITTSPTDLRAMAQAKQEAEHE